MASSVDLSRLARFRYAIINMIGHDGYPYSIPTEFETSSNGQILLKPPASSIPIVGKKVGVLFNHITAISTGGYTDRRYMLIWGDLIDSNGKAELRPEVVSEWDEKLSPFPELCARATPQGTKYLGSVRSQVEA